MSTTGPAVVPPGGGRWFVDLHCHTRWSFDSLSRPRDVVRVAAERGLTHLAITDHDRIDGALEARAAAPPGLTVIVGQEIRTSDGDLVAVFLAEAVEPGRPLGATIAAVRSQGGLVGLPHPFDRWRSSAGRAATLAAIAPDLDWVETYNARVVGRGGNERAAAYARDQALPGVAVSDAHALLEVAVACTILGGDPSTPDGLKAALRDGPHELVTGRASLVARAWTPVAKAVQRVRGVRRTTPAPTPGDR